jgi:hypothetical protein
MTGTEEMVVQHESGHCCAAACQGLGVYYVSKASSGNAPLAG